MKASQFGDLDFVSIRYELEYQAMKDKILFPQLNEYPWSLSITFEQP